MKKILMASTALVMTAGVAAADVTVGGNARMGVAYNSELADKFFFNSRVRVVFTLAGETDGGLAFGGTIRADNSVLGASGAAGNVFISGAFGRLTMGDVDGAAELVAGDAGGAIGYTELGAFQEAAYLSNAGVLARPTARYQYTFEGFTGAISASNPGAGNSVVAVGVGYSAGGYTFGLGYEDSTAASHIVVRAAATFEGITVGAMYGRLSPNVGANDSQYGVSVAGTFDATTVRAFYQKGFGDTKSYGIGASYNLGGGASLVGGIVSTDTTSTTLGLVAPSSFNGLGAGNRRTLADIGLNFTF